MNKSGKIGQEINVNIKTQTRRDFLKMSLLATCFGFCPGIILGESVKKNGSGGKYSRKQKKAFLDDFLDMNKGVKHYLTNKYNSKFAGFVTREAVKEFKKLLKKLPYLGGEKNMNTYLVPMAATYVAYYKVMRKRGRKAEVVGRMIYTLNKKSLDRIPKYTALKEGAEKFTESSINKLKEWACWSQEKEYKLDWVADFVEGDKKYFDFGYDYKECFFCKYFKKYKMSDLAPFVCINDFARSRIYGTGLHRNKTLAMGNKLCNFRYKKGRRVTQDWATEINGIRRYIKSLSAPSP